MSYAPALRSISSCACTTFVPPQHRCSTYDNNLSMRYGYLFVYVDIRGKRQVKSIVASNDT